MYNAQHDRSLSLFLQWIPGLNLHLWRLSIIGGVIIIVGLYLLSWGKEGDQEAKIKSEEESNTAHNEGVPAP